MYDLSHVKTSSAPFLRSEQSTRQIMLDVIIGLLPALALAVFLFGLRALALVAVSVAGCVCFEWLLQKIVWKKARVSDLSAVVTGMLLCYTLPVTVEWWMVLLADFFAIVIVKGLSGGLGKNALNPAGDLLSCRHVHLLPGADAAARACLLRRDRSGAHHPFHFAERTAARDLSDQHRPWHGQRLSG